MNTKQKHDLRIALAEAIAKIAKQERGIKGKRYQRIATTAIREVYRNEESIRTREV